MTSTHATRTSASITTEAGGHLFARATADCTGCHLFALSSPITVGNGNRSTARNDALSVATHRAEARLRDMHAAEAEDYGVNGDHWS